MGSSSRAFVVFGSLLVVVGIGFGLDVAALVPPAQNEITCSVGAAGGKGTERV